MNKVDLLQDIQKTIYAIDKEVDAFMISRFHKNSSVRELSNKVFIKRCLETKEVANQMVKKYDRGL